jgi:ketosteroid isomerase-like protein
MSQENVEVVRRILWDGVDVVALLKDDVARARWEADVQATFAPDCAFAWIYGGQSTEANSTDEAMSFWLDFYGPWDSVYSDVERIMPLGDRVVVLFRQYGRMAEAENMVEAFMAAVYFVRSGCVVRAEFYPDRAEALEAAGLRE